MEASALPPAERELLEEGSRTAEQIVKLQERQRRARLTFYLLVGVGLAVLGPLLAVYAALCVRLFEAML
jgi:hypothetical protein